MLKLGGNIRFEFNIITTKLKAWLLETQDVVNVYMT